MKKGLIRFPLIILMLIMSLSVMTGCKPKPKPEEAQAYVKAVMDLMCTGDYDHSVKLADIEEGKEAELRDGLIDEMIAQASSQASLNEEVTSTFKDFMVSAFGKAKYTVGEAVATEDGGYDVTVSIEPLRLFNGVEEELTAVLEEKVAAEASTIIAMSEEEQTNYVMGILIEILNEKISDPQYDPAEEVTVHYGPMEGENDVYGCTAAEGEKLGAKLFSSKDL